MKAIVFTKYGSPEVLQLKEMEKPTPGDNEVLIKIHEAIVTPTDIATRKGDPVMLRFFTGLMKPKVMLGSDFAGEVEAVGTAVTLFKKGDAVFGATDTSFGAHAEYICVPEKAVMAIKPSNRTYAEVAGICDGAMTALTFLREVAHIQSGQKILINGASGSVGGFAVQLARHFGADVTGVCSTANIELVRSLGADTVIDYKKEDFTKGDTPYDIIFDAVGKSSFSACKGVLAPTGLYLTTIPTLTVMLQMLWTSRIGPKKAVFAATGLQQTKEKLSFLTELIAAGTLKSVTDRYYPLEQIAEAHRYVEQGHKKGNVIISMSHSTN